MLKTGELTVNDCIQQLVDLLKEQVGHSFISGHQMDAIFLYASSQTVSFQLGDVETLLTI